MLFTRTALSFAVLLPVLLLGAGQTSLAVAGPRWTEAQARDWSARQPFLVGANFVPATAINQLEMWQADTFDPARIDLELGWAAGIGMNTMRVFLHDLAYQQDPPGFLRRLDQFLAIAAKHRIRPMLVLFDSVWDPFPALGPQRPPRPGVHNSGWVQSPGKVALEDPSHWPRLREYVTGVVGRFKDDARVLAWDVWNEADNLNEPAYASLEPKNKVELVLALLPQVFAWAREAQATQPLTSGVWRGGDWSHLTELPAIDRLELTLSDIITFHSYDPPAQLEARIRQLQVYHRPIVCTEYMARGNGSTFEGSLPILKKYGVGAINWGLVQGKTQTHLPWDSWRRPYVDREPAVWFHEVFRRDGTPYDAKETALIKSLAAAPASSAPSAPAPRDVELAAPDGTRLKATYFAADRPGPAVLLLHMCITTRASWEPVARQLAATGISALTIDNRGFGESGGPRFEGASPDVSRQLREKWPADFDAALAWLAAQPGVDKSRLGVGGGSCGVDNAVRLASHHAEVRSFVLLAGGADAAGINYLTSHPWLPIFGAAAADDIYDRQFPQVMRWFVEVTGNPRNRFVGFTDGGHGTEIFGPHPELVREIVDWFVDTLATAPADPAARVALKKTPLSEFWAVLNEPGGVDKATRLFRDARTRDPQVFLFPESILNQLGYARLRARHLDDAVALFKLNVEAYPASANAQDSLADAYAARGQTDLALAAEQKCLELLPADTSDSQLKESLRKAVDEKIRRLKASK